jgi:hypothetical protein
VGQPVLMRLICIESQARHRVHRSIGRYEAPPKLTELHAISRGEHTHENDDVACALLLQLIHVFGKPGEVVVIDSEIQVVAHVVDVSILDVLEPSTGKVIGFISTHACSTDYSLLSTVQRFQAIPAHVDPALDTYTVYLLLLGGLGQCRMRNVLGFYS